MDLVTKTSFDQNFKALASKISRLARHAESKRQIPAYFRSCDLYRDRAGYGAILMLMHMNERH